MKLDTHRQVETPEGLAIGLRLAGVLPRGIATLVDVSLRFAVYAICAIVISRFETMGQGVMALMFFFGEWFYYVAFETLCAGCTPGKRLLRLQVLHDDGTPVGMQASIIRNFLRIVDFLPFAYGIGITCALWSPSFRRVGDWAAGTVVVYSERRTRGVSKAKKGKVHVQDVQPEPLPVVLDREEQAALLEFSRRQGTWTEERALELSDLLEPATKQTGTPGLKKVLGYGAWLEQGR